MYQVQWAGVEARSSLLWISAGFDCVSIACMKFGVKGRHEHLINGWFFLLILGQQTDNFCVLYLLKFNVVRADNAQKFFGRFEYNDFVRFFSQVVNRLDRRDGNSDNNSLRTLCSHGTHRKPHRKPCRYAIVDNKRDLAWNRNRFSGPAIRFDAALGFLYLPFNLVREPCLIDRFRLGIVQQNRFFIVNRANCVFWRKRMPDFPNGDDIKRESERSRYFAPNDNASARKRQNHRIAFAIPREFLLQL